MDKQEGAATQKTINASHQLISGSWLKANK
jgi:hypothetical protein